MKYLLKNIRAVSSAVVAVALIAVLLVGGSVTYLALNSSPSDDDGDDYTGGGGGGGGGYATATPAPTTTDPSSTPAPTYPPVDAPALDPLGWGYAQGANYIVTQRSSANGTVYYGCYNTTSASWITAFFSTDSSVTELAILNAVTSGTICISGVAFDLALMNSIPRNVSVIESVNGQQQTFINPLDTQGSPYTISINGANYIAQDKQNQICYVSSNATVTIQTVINSLSSGEELFVESGVYLTNPLTSSIPLMLRGESMNSTIIKLNDGMNATLLTITLPTPSEHYVQNENAIVISDLTLDGNSGTNSLGNVLSVTASYFGIIENIAVINAPVMGIDFLNVADFQLKNVLVDKAGQNCINLRGGTHDITILGGTIQRSGTNYYGVSMTSESTIIGTKFWQNHFAFICSGYGNVLNTVTVESCASVAVQFNGYNNIISNSAIYSGASVGVRCAGSTAYNNLVIGNQIFNNTSNGIDETGLANYNYFDGNFLYNNASPQIEVLGVNTTATNNYLR